MIIEIMKDERRNAYENEKNFKNLEPYTILEF